VPKQRNSREDNETVKAGKTPEEWEKSNCSGSCRDRLSVEC
jgi:hypothetical protein